MTVLQKLKDLKRVLDRNLATRSTDILPILNECIIELEEQEQPKQEKKQEKPINTVDKKEIKQEPQQDVIQVQLNEPKAEINNKDTRDIDKEVKEFLKNNGVSNWKFLKREEALNKALELGFSI